MRIPPANIPNQVIRPHTPPPASRSTDQVAGQQQRLREDSYQRNSSTSAPYIDAEYVEFYTPAPKSLDQERQALDSRIELETPGKQYQTKSAGNDKTGKYQMQNHQAPPPGTYIDTFA